MAVPACNEPDGYTFDQLEEDVQERVLEKYRDWNVGHYEWWDSVYEQSVEWLSEMGYDNVEISFSGFCCQGDGASFQATVDFKKWIEAQADSYADVLGKLRLLFPQHYDEILNDTNVTIATSGRYSHEYTMEVTFVDTMAEEDFEAPEKIKPILDRLFEIADTDVIEHARDQARQIYRDLEEEHDYLTSDESIRESFEANDIRFTEEGDML